MGSEKAALPDLDLVVADVRDETPLVRRLELVRADGGVLPPWTAGAHVELRLPAGGHRAYSLVDWSETEDDTARPTRYRLGVRFAEAGGGGSRFVHGLRAGDAVRIGAPRNRFPLHKGPQEAVLLAGGIGITPLLSMAAALRRANRPFRMIYAGRSRAEMAFLAEASTLVGPALRLHADDEAGGLLPVPSLVRELRPDAVLYVCGPRPMIEAAWSAASAAGWPEGRLRFELFEAPPATAADEARGGFRVVLASSGKELAVAPGQTILEALEAAGVAPLFDCRRGDCGLCQVGVIEGVPEHRDLYLSEAERASNRLIQVCVSRSRSPVLVLDL